MVCHIEPGAVRGQGAAPWLGAHRDLLHFPALHEVNDRDGARDAVGDIRRLVGRVDRHAARLLADRDLVQLDGNVMAVLVFHLNDGETVRLTVDDDEACLVRGESKSGRAARRRESLARVQSGAVKVTRMEHPDENEQSDGTQHTRPTTIPMPAVSCSRSVNWLMCHGLFLSGGFGIVNLLKIVTRHLSLEEI